MKELDEKILEKELKALADDMPEYDDLAKQIEQSIKKKIQKTVIRTLAWVLGIILVLLLIINPFLNMVFPNPATDGEVENKEVTMAFRSYWETMQPYTEPSNIEVKKKGFGRYELVVSMHNSLESSWAGNYVLMKLNRGKYEVTNDPKGLTTHVMGRFECDWNQKEEVLKKVRELPPSAVLYLSVGTKTPKSIEELRKEQVKLQWVEIYQPNVEFQGGLNMRVSSAWDKKDVEREKMSMEELKDVYLSNLENIMAHPEILDSFGVSCGSMIYSTEGGRHREVLEACYEDAKKLKTLESRNYCISGKRDEIAAYLEKTDIASILVDDLKLSELGR